MHTEKVFLKPHTAAWIYGAIFCVSDRPLLSFSVAWNLRTSFSALLSYFLTRIFLSASVFQVPYSSVISHHPRWLYYFFHDTAAVMGLLFLRSIISAGFRDSHHHCFLWLSALSLTIMGATRFYWWRYIFLHFRNLCFVCHHLKKCMLCLSYFMSQK